MAETLVSTQPRLRITPFYVLRMLIRALAVMGIVLLVVFRGDVSAMLGYFARLPGGFSRPHSPNLALLLDAGPAVLLHVVTVLGALAVGTILMAGVKGSLAHRIFGWLWICLMLATAITALFIHRLNPHGFSLLHLFSAYTLIAVPLAILAVRKGRVNWHGRLMAGSYIGALLIAGATALLPGRIMWLVFFS